MEIFSSYTLSTCSVILILIARIIISWRMALRLMVHQFPASFLEPFLCTGQASAIFLLFSYWNNFDLLKLFFFPILCKVLLKLSLNPPNILVTFDLPHGVSCSILKDKIPVYKRQSFLRENHPNLLFSPVGLLLDHSDFFSNFSTVCLEC